MTIVDRIGWLYIIEFINNKWTHKHIKYWPDMKQVRLNVVLFLMTIAERKYDK